MTLSNRLASLALVLFTPSLALASEPGPDASEPTLAQPGEPTAPDVVVPPPTAEPPPRPTSSPAPASAPVAAAPVVATPVAADPIPAATTSDVAPPRVDPVEVFTARRGFRMVTAGISVAAAGVAWTGISAVALKDDPRHGLALGFAVNGAVATLVGVSVAAAGAKRLKQPGVWLDAKAGRRDRMAGAAAGFAPHEPQTSAELAVVARGTKLRNYGMMTLASGFGLFAFGTGMQYAFASDKLAPRIVVPAVSAPFVAVGAALLAAGGRRIHHSDRYVDRRHALSGKTPRVQLTTAPAIGRGTMGIALSGRF